MGEQDDSIQRETSAEVASDGAVKVIHCVRCGYDLYGLSEDAKCPECATPVERSRHNLLRDADPTWLRLVHRGMKAAYVGLRSFFLLVLLWFFMILGLGVLDVWLDVAEDVLELLSNVILTLFVVAFIAALITMGLGAWLISTREPRETEAHQFTLAYHILSALVVPAVGLWVAFAGPFVIAHPVIEQLVAHVCFAILVAHGWIMIDHRRALERRLPHPHQDEHKRTPAFPRFLIVMIVLLALYWLLPMFFATGQTSWRLPGGQAQQFLLFFTLIMWFALLGSLVTLRHRIAKEREAARERETERMTAQLL